VSRVQETIATHLRGAKIMKASALLMLVGVGPIFLYALLGPRDGNPIGLGLLAFFSFPVASAGLVAGAIKLAAERLARRRG
jgi:hypothetical protein